MTKKEQDELIKYLAKWMCEKKVYVNVNQTVDQSSTDGFVFIQHPDIGGVLAFGKTYPLHGCDVDASSIITVGRVVFEHKGNRHGLAFKGETDNCLYMDKLGKVKLIKI